MNADAAMLLRPVWLRFFGGTVLDSDELLELPVVGPLAHKTYIHISFST